MSTTTAFAFLTFFCEPTMRDRGDFKYETETMRTMRDRKTIAYSIIQDASGKILCSLIVRRQVRGDEQSWQIHIEYLFILFEN